MSRSRWRKSKAESDESTTEPRLVVPAQSAAQTLNGPIQVVGQYVKMKGELSANADLRVDGSVEGRIELPENKLIVGATGRVTADVNAQNVVVRGMVVGDIVAEDRVEILPTGMVYGDIRARRLILAEGSHFSGRVNDADSASASAEEAPVVKMTGTDPTPERGLRLKRDDRMAMWTLVDNRGDV